MDLEYKLIREQFIGGHNGSTVEEVIAITVVNQLANFLLIAVLSLFPVLTHPKVKWIRYITEFVVIIVPFVLCVTLLSNYIYLICLTIILLTISVILLCFAKRQSNPIVMKELLKVCPKYPNRLPFLSNLLSTLLLCVCIAILAVDFHVFSRRFAKTELYGWSLMDVGVGSFVAINAGFSPESRFGSKSGYDPLFFWKKTLFAAIPLIILGVQRLIAVKTLGYHEHITEYGLHWNFFFTLAFTKLISTTFCCLFSKKVNIGFCGLLLLVLHQICLSLGLSEFIQNPDRSGLFAANKEGIISLMGYIALYLIFVEIGKYCFYIKSNIGDWFQLSLELLLLSITSGLLMLLSHNYIESISRREVNLSFVLWMTSLISIFIGLEFFIQAIVHCLQHLNVFYSGPSNTSIIFSSIGYSGMLVFLVSNLLTGFVNFTFDTISASDSTAFLILIIYCLALCFVSVFCFYYKIKLKIPVKQKSN